MKKKSKAGRKPVDDKKRTVPIYPQQSRIDLIGLERLKEIAIKAVEREYKKLSKNELQFYQNNRKGEVP